MDSPSKFFFSLEKKNGQSRQIHALRSEDGHQLTDIVEDQVDDAVFDSFCENLPTVSEETNRELEGPLTEEEVFVALQSVQGGKAPGINGLPSEFSEFSGLYF